MHITAVCPSCLTQYQLDAALIGQRMRCPNAGVRGVFEARAPSAKKEPPRDRPDPRPTGRQTQQKGAVGDMIPILPAEPEAGSDAWNSARPPRAVPGGG